MSPEQRHTSNPGPLGWLLQKAESPLERVDSYKGRGLLFRTTCPVCNSGDALLAGPVPEDEGDDGILVCKPCERQFGVEEVDVGAEYSPGLQAAALDIIARLAGYPDRDTALADARAAVSAMLPPVIDLRSPREDIVAVAVLQLEGEGKPEGLAAYQVEAALRARFRWVDRWGRPTADPLPWVVAEVQKQLQLRAAHRVATAAIELACLRTGRADVQANHLLEHAPTECGQALKILDRVPSSPVNERAVGIALRSLPETPVDGARIVRTGKTTGGWRWSVIR